MGQPFITVPALGHRLSPILGRCKTYQPPFPVIGIRSLSCRDSSLKHIDAVEPEGKAWCTLDRDGVENPGLML